MMRIWVGTALLAGSWLLGQSYYLPAHPQAWVCLVVWVSVVVLGVLFLALVANLTLLPLLLRWWKIS